jgi:hypothetical protein
MAVVHGITRQTCQAETAWCQGRQENRAIPKNPLNENLLEQFLGTACRAWHAWHPWRWEICIEDTEVCVGEGSG